ncbi:MAG: glucose-1-phosphate adenylyltransferase subunit GlgD [Clostridiales bacterium]|nr:glucose-1-phosphate adenylyltransferase subunit GlgD [Clostridiales bacterium]
MRSNNVLGFIFADTLENKLAELASSRTTASIPIGGKYRLIDFVLSNMSNSGINNVGIVAKSNYQSLMDHVGSGSAYDLSKRRSNLTILPPCGGKTFSSFVETIYNMHGYIEHCREDYILLAQGNIVTNLDYSEVFDFHSKNNADITLVYSTGSVPSGYEQPVILDVADDGRVERVLINPEVSGGEFNLMYGTILIKKDLLMSEIRHALSLNQLDAKRMIQKAVDKYRTFAFKNSGYCAAISSINDYFKFNTDLMKKEIRDDLFNPKRPIYTKVRDDKPSRYGLTCKVKNSMIAQGCVIDGEVENCVLSKGVCVGEGAKISNCIVMQDTKIGCNTNLNYVIIDKDVTIKDGRSLMGYDSYPIYIAKKSVV